MKEQALDAGTREALGSLIELAGALGLSAILVIGLLPRRGSREHDLGLTVFETFAVTAVLVTAGMTALFAAGYLRADDPVTDGQFNQLATSLALAVVLLVLLGGIARFFSLPGGLGANLPILAVTLFAATAIGFIISIVPQRPENIAPAGAAVLAAGACVAWIFLRVEGWGSRSGAAMMRKRMVLLSAQGYRPVEMTVLPGVPTRPENKAQLRLVGWSKKGRLFLDDSGCRRLQDEARGRWGERSTGRTEEPLASIVLTQARLKTRLLPWPPRLELAVQFYRHGDGGPKEYVLEADDQGLVDLTDTELVEAAAD